MKANPTDKGQRGLPKAEGADGLRGVMATGYSVPFGEDESILKLTVIIVAHLWEYIKSLNCTV